MPNRPDRSAALLDEAMTARAARQAQAAADAQATLDRIDAEQADRALVTR